MPPEAQAVTVQRSDFVVTIPVAGAVASGTAPIRVALPFDAELVSVTGTLTAASSAGAITLDVKKNGTTVYSGANAAAAKSTFAVAALVGTVSKATPKVAASTTVIGAGGAQYSPGTNVITPYVSDGVNLGDIVAGVDYLDVVIAGAPTGATGLTVVLHFNKK
jgi:hypothetical protein